MWQGHSLGKFSHHRGHLETVDHQEMEQNDGNGGMDDVKRARG